MPDGTGQRNIVLVIGGARSGKSRYALESAERRWPTPLYLATAEGGDEEMRRRIELHRQARGPRWRCAEEPLDVAAILRSPPAPCDGILLDCVTIWLSNVLLREGREGVARRRADLLAALRASGPDVILVSNEVGMGIVPPSELGREFRDLAGWLNQDLAAVAPQVVFVVAGLPLALKGALPCAG